MAVDVLTNRALNRATSEFAPRLAGVDTKPVLAWARVLLTEQPLTGRQLRAVWAIASTCSHRIAWARRS